MQQTGRRILMLGTFPVPGSTCLVSVQTDYMMTMHSTLVLRPSYENSPAVDSTKVSVDDGLRIKLMSTNHICAKEENNP